VGTVRLLLDTHAFYWWCIGDGALSLSAQAAIADPANESFVSAITAWELIAKFRSGKEPAFAAVAADVSGTVAAQGFTVLPITLSHGEASANLPLHHKDPMDRFLIAQAIVEDMTIVTADRSFAAYAAQLLW
jgi:PIN domain nuclease of toxin-antitoxin system